MLYKCEPNQPQWVGWLAVAGLSVVSIVVKALQGKPFPSESALLIVELLAAVFFGVRAYRERRHPLKEQNKFPLPNWLSCLLVISLFCLIDAVFLLMEEPKASWILGAYLACILFSGFHLFRWNKARRAWQERKREQADSETVK